MLDVNTITADSLEKTISGVLSNPIYAENAKATQTLVTDHLVEPKKQFLYWVNYVVRHNGAKHLIHEFVHEMSIIEFWSLDVYFVIILTITLVFTIIFILLFWMCKLLARMCFNKVKQE